MSEQLTPLQVRELFEKQKENNLSGIETIKENVVSYFQKGFDHWSSQIIKILRLQATELAIFRELEFHVQHESLTTELLQDLLGRLSNFRQEASEAHKKHQATTEATTTTTQSDAGVV